MEKSSFCIFFDFLLLSLLLIIHKESTLIVVISQFRCDLFVKNFLNLG